MSPHDINDMEPSPVRNGFHDDDVVPRLVNGAANGNTNGTTINGSAAQDFPKSPYLRPAEADAVLDLICVGFGPASVAIAVALHDTMEAGKLAQAPKVLFLEKQPQFSWHAGMLLPGAKMQISFIKDLASLRDPRSNFTFLNYLHKNSRLVDFVNLSTFMPARAEFEDYLRWCARHFENVVQYQNEVLSISPVHEEGPRRMFAVTSRNTTTGVTTTRRARNVVVAVGGQASIPRIFPARHPRIIHSSQYAQLVPKIMNDSSASYRVAVIGAGQSAAEIFSNLQTLYPNSKTYMVMRSEFLKPSDDSPFVNSIFNPEFIDTIYPKSYAYRASLLADARATNYSVVRLELIEHLFEVMYHQKRTLGPDERKWPHRILAGRHILGVEEKGDGLRLKVAALPDPDLPDGPHLEEESLDVDLIICATGYKRTAHVDMLRDTWHLLPEVDATGESGNQRGDRWLVETGKNDTTSTRVMEVGRDYGIKFSKGAVAPGSGIWLQGCCEATHGLSDTLLSVLSTRSGEMVRSIFGASA
ncbi:L-lysine 6-monooxygenase (NADPH-requiring)-domain-containing protein [Achaetomium macrosporum]|uniref:L-ornithine N(5)-monooxygenase [NAD(P)H] n=1 Tax=Achaetomium macrosporum TaxID=79813 RepID=A0AAN7C6Y8_9PEZI|nr:L-lysine 6-monooxygenase (NADPH-requiring)-domain-containing protein [Achaetomium macrosporum]